MKKAFIFPGQGSQYLGMAKDFYDNFKESKRVFEDSSDILHKDMTKLIFGDEVEALNLTSNTQPSILTATKAMLEVVIKEGIKCDVSAGLSLGEYSSLVYSEAIDYRDALPLVSKRGELMINACRDKECAMAAVIGFPKNRIIEICNEVSKDSQFVAPANFNSIIQVVISGEKSGVKKCIEIIKSERGKVIPLPITSPFHTKLLSEASMGLEEILLSVDLKEPRIPIYFNVHGKIEEKPLEIKKLLVKQVSSSVLWIDSMINMLEDGVDTFIEIGPGKTLSGFLKKLPYEYKVYNINSVSTLKETVEKIGGKQCQK